MTETLVLDGITFAVARSHRRTTAAIVIHRDGQLVLQVPEALDTENLRSAAGARLPWVHRKLSERLLRARIPRKEFVAGEAFRYLGRNYRLAFADGADAPARLRHGRLEVRRDRAADAEPMLREWYEEHARAWFVHRLRLWTDRMGMPAQPVAIRDLGYRWASFSEEGAVNVHWQAIALPPTINDYLLVHELTHFEHPTHDRAFWRAVTKVLPDAERRRDWLREKGEGW